MGEENQTVKRSTSKKILYTFVVLVAVFLFMSVVLREFSFALFIKSSVGTLVAGLIFLVIERMIIERASNNGKKGEDPNSN
jgi:preprotein translocase subunit SecF